MTNYTKTTDFAAKDSLPSGDSGKIIRGSEFETEFDNIATAVNSKSDANNPTFTGTVTIDGLTVNGNTVLGNAATDTVTVTADIASNLLPSADDTYNLGAVGAEWNDLFIDGVANIDSLVANTADINGGTVDGVTIGGSSAGAITGTTITGTSFVASGNMTFGDNDKALFGAGSDLEIYHNGNHSFITDTGTGSLYIRASDDLRIQTATNEEMLKAEANGAVTVYHDNSAKLATTSTGIDVTGTVTADGALIESSANTQLRISDSTSANQRLDLEHDAGVSEIISGNNGAFGSVKIQAFNGTSTVDRLQIKPSGDIEFYEDTGTTPKFFWDASTERLGIGTISPSTTLDVSGTATISEGSSGSTASSDSNTLVVENSGNSGMSILSPNGSSSQLRLGDVTDSSSAFVQYNSTDNLMTVGTSRASGELRFTTGNVGERVRIDASGNVGIGTDSPERSLHVKSTASLNAGIIESTSATSSLLCFANNGTASTSTVRVGSTDNAFVIHTNSSGVGVERMRIDSSGNVLVGKTSALSLTTAGHELHADGLSVSTRDSDVVTILNRETNDGSILQFRKDNTVVGSIGVNSSNAYFASSEFGIKPTSVGLVSTNTSGVAQDGAEDLGGSSFRWRDLYLSGGAYLGGTAAANKLDDYEEGTWTPTLADAASGGNTGTATTIEGRYTKVGRQIVIVVKVEDVDTTGMTGANNMFIRGLPFAAGSGTTGQSQGSLRLDRVDLIADCCGIVSSTTPSTAYLTLRQTVDNSADVQIKVQDFTSGSADIFATITYFV